MPNRYESITLEDLYKEKERRQALAGDGSGEQPLAPEPPSSSPRSLKDAYYDPSMGPIPVNGTHVGASLEDVSLEELYAEKARRQSRQVPQVDTTGMVKSVPTEGFEPQPVPQETVQEPLQAPSFRLQDPIAAAAQPLGNALSNVTQNVLDHLGREKETSMLKAGKLGLQHGVTGLAETVGTGVQYLGGKVGSEAIEGFGKESSDYWERKAETYETPEDLQGSVLDNKKDTLFNLSWWAYNVADMAPSFAAAMVPGVAAGKYISIAGQAIKLTPAVIQKLATIGAAVSSGTGGGGMEGMSTYKEVLNRGGSKKDAESAAELMTLAAGALNAISFGRIFKKSKSKIIKFITSGTTEGGTEYLEEPAEVAIKRGLLTEKQFTEEEAWEQLRQGWNVVGPAFVIGAGGSLTQRSGPPEHAPEGTPSGVDVPGAVPIDKQAEPVPSGVDVEGSIPIDALEGQDRERVIERVKQNTPEVIEANRAKIKKQLGLSDEAIDALIEGKKAPEVPVQEPETFELEPLPEEKMGKIINEKQLKGRTRTTYKVSDTEKRIVTIDDTTGETIRDTKIFEHDNVRLTADTEEDSPSSIKISFPKEGKIRIQIITEDGTFDSPTPGNFTPENYLQRLKEIGWTFGEQQPTKESKDAEKVRKDEGQVQERGDERQVGKDKGGEDIQPTEETGAEAGVGEEARVKGQNIADEINAESPRTDLRYDGEQELVPGKILYSFTPRGLQGGTIQVKSLDAETVKAKLKESQAEFTGEVSPDVEKGAGGEVESSDEIILKARAGDKEAQAKLKEYGLDWDEGQKYRIVDQSEIDELESAETVTSSRNKNGITDITDTPDYGKVRRTPGRTYRIKFKNTPKFDSKLKGTKTSQKNKEAGEYHLKGGYDRNDIESIEFLNDKGEWVEYNPPTIQSYGEAEQPTDRAEWEATPKIAKLNETINQSAPSETDLIKWAKKQKGNEELTGLVGKYKNAKKSKYKGHEEDAENALEAIENIHEETVRDPAIEKAQKEKEGLWQEKQKEYTPEQIKGIKILVPMELEGRVSMQPVEASEVLAEKRAERTSYQNLLECLKRKS